MTKAKSVILTIMTITMLCLSAGTVYAGMNDVQKTIPNCLATRTASDYDEMNRFYAQKDFKMIKLMIADERLFLLKEDTEVYIVSAASQTVLRIRLKGTEIHYYIEIASIKGALEVSPEDERSKFHDKFGY